MNKVAKILLVNQDNKYLVLTRNNHPKFGNDVDLPGGTIEDKEDIKDALKREVLEETGIILDINFSLIYSSDKYSKQQTQYNLFIGKLNETPNIKLSWEHISYDWLDIDELKKILKHSNDTYMHMVRDELKSHLIK